MASLSDFRLDVRVPPAPTGHPYFDTLSAHPRLLRAVSLRTNEQIKSLETVKFGLSPLGELRYPVVYDPAVDAACWRIDPRTVNGVKGSTDGEGKRIPLGVTSGSLLITWDLRFNAEHAYRGSGYQTRHKTFLVGWHASGSGDNRWLGVRTDYENATKKKQGVAELFPCFYEPRWCAAGTTLGAQTSILPKVGTFFLEPNAWARIWIYVEDIGQPVSSLSIWAADASRGPVQINNRNAVITPPGGLTKFWFEYDTSQEEALNGDMRSWNRDFVALQNVPASDVPALLERPR